MEGLRTTWDEKKFDTIRVGLSRLVSPMFKKDQAETNSDFQIRLELPGRFQVLSGLIKSPEALKSPNYIIRGDVDENGNYNLKATIMDLPAEILKRQFIFDDEHSPECGPFHIELRVWDRDRNSLAEIAKKYGSTMADLSRDLDAAAGISIYRDGFRLMPYGEPYNDWLRLDRRRVNNPTRNLSNNQIVGYVLISADKNQRLHEQSNREGLMEGAAFNDLRELVKMVLTEIEIRRYDIRHPKGKTPRSKTAGGLFTNFDLKPVRDQIIKQYPKDLKLLSLVDETEKDLGRRVIEVQEVLSRYRRLATLGQLIDTVLHEGRGPLAKIGIEAGLGIRDIDRNEVGKETLISYSKERFNTIKNQSNILSTVFDRIEPFGGRKRGRPSRISLEKVIKDAFSILNGKIIEVGSNVILPEGDTYVTVDEAEIQQVIINLLDNSLYWLRLVPKDTRQILVKTKRKNPDEVEIIFSDSGPGVDPKFGDRIFEPYFSSKPDGMGLGLMIAGEIISDYYDGSLELLPEGPLSGATFRITLCRRV